MRFWIWNWMLLNACCLMIDPPLGTVYIGSVVNVQEGDSPVKINDRFDYKQLSFWNFEFNISESIDAGGMINVYHQLVETNSNAFMILTIYPVKGFNAVSDDVIRSLANTLLYIAKRKRYVVVRYAPEMNVSWQPYGQSPTSFRMAWYRLVKSIRNLTKSNQRIKFLWSPAVANAYPFIHGQYSTYANETNFDIALDYNRDGLFNSSDDPYSPYYPGDDLVDFVGLSIYHNAITTLPEPGEVEASIDGGNFGFYSMFSAPKSPKTSPLSNGNKPLIIPESGSAYPLFSVSNYGTVNETERVSVREGFEPITMNTGHFNGSEFLPVPDGQKQPVLQSKQIWWRQLLDQDLLEKFPQIKAIGFNENYKVKDGYLSDYRILGDGVTYTQHGQDVLDAFRNDSIHIFSETIAWGLQKNGGLWYRLVHRYPYLQIESIDLYLVFLPFILIGVPIVLLIPEIQHSLR